MLTRQGLPSSTALVVGATSPLAMIRFHGRNRETWETPGLTAAERFQYLYSEDELREWVPAAQGLARQADRAHVLFNNCYQHYGVRKARQIGLLLAV